ncbi:MAG: hypothetical protein D6741_11290 [Planctomycetota bacterium]|nr:MAG: hypothetical protein D6741_11290 [Planctomycetota bacterium]
MKRVCVWTTAVAIALFGSVAVFAGEFRVEKTEHGATVTCDGKLVTNYLIDVGHKPILWPVIGPTGKPMTRAWPMGEGPNEKHDHPHHKSLWFTHGSVGGTSFWEATDTTGYVKHREFVRLEGGEAAVIQTINDWVTPEGKKILEDERTIRIWDDHGKRYIDFDIVLKAVGEPVKFGDTKEGSFGIRVPGTMKVDAGLGGHILNSNGQKDREAWGKRASWVDYYGPVEGETLGIAILNHPASFRYPTYWHVRTYGLFAANPFGWHNFVGSSDVDGSYTVSPAKPISLFYRVVLHKGDASAGEIAREFESYAKVAK